MDLGVIVALFSAPFVLALLFFLALLLWPRGRHSEGLAGCLYRRIRHKLRPATLDASTLQNAVSRKERLSDVDFGVLNEAFAIAAGQTVRVSKPIMSIAGDDVEVWQPSRDDVGKVILSGPEHRRFQEVKPGETWNFKQVTLVAGDLGEIMRLDSRGDALIRFEWDKKEFWIDRRDFRSLVPTLEFPARCGDSCTQKHDAHSKCFKCGEPWSQHKAEHFSLKGSQHTAGHKCADGGRGSFLLGSLQKGQAAWAVHDGAWKAGTVMKVDPLHVALDEWAPRPPCQPEISTSRRLGFDQDTRRLFGYQSLTPIVPIMEQRTLEPILDLILAPEYVPVEMPGQGFLCGCGDDFGTKMPQRVTMSNPVTLQEGSVYTWAWGDLPPGALLNPLRWSSYTTRQAIAAELRTYDQSTTLRPVHVMDRADADIVFCDAQVAIAQLGAKEIYVAKPPPPVGQ